ncbi:MAG: hypothetical protein M1814_000190 [Vezdaea aestivalis]|nr:MAG: hypothetical protein M1814_000190 [Vezdaea aestivalis]
MPTRSRAAARTAQPEEEPDEQEQQAQEEQRELGSRLEFNEALSWRAGKPIPLADLLRRLEALATELRGLDQEEGDNGTFAGVAKELAAHGLLSHKDKGVKAWVACCLVHILRLCAPDAPFTTQQLKEIFGLFVNTIIPSLSDPSHAYNVQHISVVQSLAEIKSVVIMTDLPSADSLIVKLFAASFDILSGAAKSPSGIQVGKHVEHYLTEILVIMVDEASSLPTEVIETIVAQFLRADPSSLSSGSSKRKRDDIIDERQSTFELKEVPPAYNMAKLICNSCPEKMARYISQYFNDVILNAKPPSSSSNHKSHRKSAVSREDWDSDDGAEGPSEEDLGELNKTHKLLRELWRASPAVLQNVIPQLEAELSAENVDLRVLATETLGDIISGIGAAGPPRPPVLDPTAYPPATYSTSADPALSTNVLTTPASPQSFPQSHPGAYACFLSRRNDKSPIIRAAWTIAIGRIVTTAAGGVGLSQHEEKDLVSALGEKLIDADDRVRIAAIESVSMFSFRDVIIKLGPSGGFNTPGSVLSNLAERVKDKKHSVRQDAIITLAKLWGVASGEIAAGNETVSSILSSIPSRILDAFYVNDQDINVMIDSAVYELLLPLSYPPPKKKTKAGLGSQTQEASSQANGHSNTTPDADMLRAERSLLLAKGLDDRAKKVFFSMQARQNQWAQVFQAFLKKCSEYNGGEVDPKAPVNIPALKAALHNLVKWFCENLPEPIRVNADLWKFIKANDRRSYHLLNFMMNADSDFKTALNALKETKKRFTDSTIALSPTALESMLPIFYRVGLFTYNRSHVPAIVEISRTDKNGLGATAHEFLKEISTRAPEVFKSHVKELCRSLEDETPTAKHTNQPIAVDTLKACAGFAQKFPNELPQERKFKKCLKSFAQYGSPHAASKHAVTILMASSDTYGSASDLVDLSLKDFKFGGDHFLAKLATLSQLCLLAPSETVVKEEAILDLVLKEVLAKVHTSLGESDPGWVADADLDDEITAKLICLKLLVNRLRARPDPAEAKEMAPRVYQLLMVLINNDGELSKKKDTPESHKARLKLMAAKLFLRLCKLKSYEELLGATPFHQLACTAQDPNPNIRKAFMDKLKKYLGQGHLSHRFYTIPFLLDSESLEPLRASTTTWLRSRALSFAANKNTVMEMTLARLLSLLAHHPQFSSDTSTLLGAASNIIFYLVPVAREENLGLIYYIAQRVKSVRDVITPDKSENLYILSDLAQALIRRWEDIHGWSMQSWPLKLRMPSSLFAMLPSHEVAQDIAIKTYLPPDMDDQLDALVKAAVKIKVKKRKSEIPGEEHARKRSRTSTGPLKKKKKHLAIRNGPKSKESKTPKGKKDNVTSSSERRKSGRLTEKEGMYAESSSSGQEDEEMNDISEEGDEDVEETDDGSGEEEAAEQGEESAEEEETEEAPAKASAPQSKPEPRTGRRSTRSTRATNGANAKD